MRPLRDALVPPDARLSCLLGPSLVPQPPVGERPPRDRGRFPRPGPAPSLGAPRRASLVAIPDVFPSFSGSLRRRRPARGDWTPALRPAVRGSSARPSRRRRSSTPRPPRRRSSARRSSLVRRTDLRGVLEHRAIAARIQSNRSGRLPWTSRRQNNAPLRKTPAARLKAALADHRLRPPQRRARPTLVRRT
jgi:hypothetical protein